MNFVKFPAGTTNVFPIANSTSGGQLVTEWNLRSRESVSTDEDVKYFIGPSFVHAMDEFYVSAQSDEESDIVSGSVLGITGGRAVVNGHYFETQSEISIDLAEANSWLKQDDQDPLIGKLAVGLRAMYSTEQTLAATLLTDDGRSLILGIQVVILPIGEIAPGYFVLPEDSPEEENLVTAHLKLAEFYYTNGQIRTVVQNPDKTKSIPSSRIEGIEDLLASYYVSRKGLNPKKLYTFAGKEYDPETGRDTWCDSTDALFIWQKASDLKTTEDPQLPQAEFGTDDKEYTTLTLPHKHVDGGLFNSEGKEVWYEPRVMRLPKASYSLNSPGTISGDYTRSVKHIRELINDFYQFTRGKQRAFVDEIKDEQRTELPSINQRSWDVGDYVVVRKDNSVVASTTSLIQAPSSLYFVIPPIVREVKFEVQVGNNNETQDQINKTLNDHGLSGTEIHYDEHDMGGMDKDPELIVDELNTLVERLTTDSEYYNGKDIFDLESVQYRGVVNTDFFVYVLKNIPIQQGDKKVLQDWKFYFKISKNDVNKDYSEPVLLTGTIPLATEDTIGGFYNVTDTDFDNGYVYRDEEGHLVLLDYSLLRTGVLAYQLGDDYDLGGGQTIQDLQNDLDEYVNNRVAFPTEKHLEDCIYPNMIELKVTLSGGDDSYQTLLIHNIDSRFDTGVCLHILGEATEKITVNVENIEKLRIAKIEGNPVVNVRNCGLYYDGDIIDQINLSKRVHKSDPYDPLYTGPTYPDGFTGFQDLRLWYQKFEDEDPDLIVDGMTVTETNTPVIPDDFDFWNEEVVNDNHYFYGLQSLTFAPNGVLAGAGLYMRNDTTANIDLNKSIQYAPFTLPQGSNFKYPKSSLQKPIKITGSFVVAYAASYPPGYTVINTQFTALTQVYDYFSDVVMADGSDPKGTISFLADAQFIDNYIGLKENQPIDGWEPNGYHVFKGWTIG